MSQRLKVLREWAILIALPFLVADAQAYEARYIGPTAVDLVQFLGPPPAAGSAVAQQDLDAVIRAQDARTPDSVAASKADAVVSVFRFSDVLGPAFRGDRLPKTQALFKAVALDASQIGLRAKEHWQRPRPYRVSERVQPIVGVSTDGSYPSGHSMYGCLAAVLLGVIVPEQRDALLKRGSEFGLHRIVGGVHYPTDVEAGCTAGKITAAVLLQTPGFQADFAAARDETRQGLGLAPAGGTR
ncbi:MAG: phosphatase PAP2 family protein [Gammaproteobacteria bacterium]